MVPLNGSNGSLMGMLGWNTKPKTAGNSQQRMFSAGFLKIMQYKELLSTLEPGKNFTPDGCPRS